MKSTKQTVNPRKEARTRARVSMVRIAGTVNCSLQTVQRYELDPSSIRDDLRVALDAAYAQLRAA